MPLPPEVAGLLEAEDFRGRARQTLLLYPRGAIAAKRLLLVGLGKQRSSEQREHSAGGRRCGAKGARTASACCNGWRSWRDCRWPPAVTGQAFAEGIELGAYRYWKYRTGLSTEQTFEVKNATVFTTGDREQQLRKGAAVGQAIAHGVELARDLVNGPGYAMTPARLGDEAVSLGKRLGLKVTVLDKAQLAEQGFGGILAVGKGSANDPRFIVMEYGAAASRTRRPFVWSAKGLTFDSGGLSLKPADAMETMKSDMGGAAAVFGAMQVVAELKLPLHVVGLVSAAENMPSSRRPIAPAIL